MIEYTRTKGCNVICLEVALRTISAACKLVMPKASARGSRQADAISHIVSAVGEAYNNIVLHGYAGREPGTIQIHIENCREWMRVMIKDTGTSFDPAQAKPPDLEALPESGLGIFIMRSFVDEMTYVPGTDGSPNVLMLFKRLDEIPPSAINTHRPA